MISRGTTVSVGRIPLPRGEKKIWREDRVAKADLSVLTETSERMFSGASGSDGQPVKTEEERLQQIVDNSGNEYGASNWERIRYNTKVYMKISNKAVFPISIFRGSVVDTSLMHAPAKNIE